MIKLGIQSDDQIRVYISPSTGFREKPKGMSKMEDFFFPFAKNDFNELE